MLIPKKCGVIFFGHRKVIFRPLEDMTPRSHLFDYLNTWLTSRVTHKNDRKCSGNIIKLKKTRGPGALTFANSIAKNQL